MADKGIIAVSVSEFERMEKQIITLTTELKQVKDELVIAIKKAEGTYGLAKLDLENQIVEAKAELATVTEKGEAVTNALGVSMIEVHDLKVDLGEFGGHTGDCATLEPNQMGDPPKKCDCGWDKVSKELGV